MAVALSDGIHVAGPLARAGMAGVREVAVVGVPDAQFGQRLRAVVSLEPGAELSETELQDHVRTHLARYKVPREVVFVERIARNVTGKILKRELRGPST
jgi:fatty-acyl-CoA synthase